MRPNPLWTGSRGREDRHNKTIEKRQGLALRFRHAEFEMSGLLVKNSHRCTGVHVAAQKRGSKVWVNM